MFSAINHYSNQTLKRKKKHNSKCAYKFSITFHFFLFTSSHLTYVFLPCHQYIIHIWTNVCVHVCVLTTPPTTRTPIEVREVREARPVTMETISSSWVMELCGNGGMLVLTGVRAMVRGTCRENTAENSTEQSTKRLARRAADSPVYMWKCSWMRNWSQNCG